MEMESFKALNELVNNNILNFRAQSETSNNFYFFYDYCQGPSLKEYQEYYFNKYKRQFNEVFIQKIIRQLINGLEYIHSKNIVHRNLNLKTISIHFDKYSNFLNNETFPPDIKLDDINLNESFTIKINNFYYSKLIKEDNKDKMTQIGFNKNSPPEAIKNSKYDTRFDLWCLGGIVYELLTGNQAFPGENMEEIFSKMEEGKYIIPNGLVSVEILTFINGLLRYDPNNRMNWKEIKNHDFIKKNADNFTYKIDPLDIRELNTQNNSLEDYLKDEEIKKKLEEYFHENYYVKEAIQKERKQIEEDLKYFNWEKEDIDKMITQIPENNIIESK